jgi:hypothetical protein
MDRETREVSRVLFAILAYLIDHPEADDTIEGIAQWWILKQRIRQQILVIEKALGVLVDKGFVLKQCSRNGRTCYRINRRMHKQIAAFLENRQKYPDCNNGY